MSKGCKCSETPQEGKLSDFPTKSSAHRKELRMPILDEAAGTLEALGFKHAPVQYLLCHECGASTRESDGRYVTMRDPPGVYYLRGDDNMDARRAAGREAEDCVQVVGLFAEFDPAIVSAALDWEITSHGLIPGPDGKTPIGTTAFFMPKKEEQMTTSVKIHVNGRYHATVVQKNASGEIVMTADVHGNYEGSPNPIGEQVFWLTHPAQATFEVSEEAVVDAPVPDSPLPAAE
jgi:hypothetical protein